LLPGQPVTFTLTITNNSEYPVHNLHLQEDLPGIFTLSAITSTDSTLSDESGGVRVQAIPGSSSASVNVVGTISTTLNADQFFTNTATLSNSVTALMTATASSNVKVPVLSWSQALYSATESSGVFFTTINITPVNPYAGIFAVAYTPDSSGNSINANSASF